MATPSGAELIKPSNSGSPAAETPVSSSNAEIDDDGSTASKGTNLSGKAPIHIDSDRARVGNESSKESGDQSSEDSDDGGTSYHVGEPSGSSVGKVDGESLVPDLYADDLKQCRICWEKFEPGCSGNWELSCTHLFHMGCLLRLFVSQGKLFSAILPIHGHGFVVIISSRC